MTYKFTKEQIETAINSTLEENGTTSMKAAARYLNIKYDTFRKYAQIFDLWKPNPFGVGRNKHQLKPKKIDINEILEGLHPQYDTNKLKKRLINEKSWSKVCSWCNLSKWLETDIPLELDHIDGNRFNHKLNNLRLLCPNCHALTDTYCGKNIGKYNS